MVPAGQGEGQRHASDIARSGGSTPRVARASRSTSAQTAPGHSRSVHCYASIRERSEAKRTRHRYVKPTRLITASGVITANAANIGDNRQRPTKINRSVLTAGRPLRPRPPQNIELLTHHQVLGFKHRSRAEQADRRPPDQFAKIFHRAQHHPIRTYALPDDVCGGTVQYFEVLPSLHCVRPSTRRAAPFALRSAARIGSKSDRDSPLPLDIAQAGALQSGKAAAL